MLRVGQPEWDDIKIWGSSSGTLDINVASHVGHQFITSSKTKVSRSFFKLVKRKKETFAFVCIRASRFLIVSDQKWTTILMIPASPRVE